MNLILSFLMISVFILGNSFAEEFNGEDMKNTWQDIWSDGHELLLVDLPSNTAKRKVYKTEGGYHLTIEHRRFSSIDNVVAFTVGNFGHPPLADSLYISKDNVEVERIGNSINGLLNLVGILNGHRILLAGENIRVNNGVFVQEKTAQDKDYFFIFNYETKELKKLVDLGNLTLGMENGVCAGNLIAYGIKGGVRTYNVDSKASVDIDFEGDLDAISPDGENLLLRNEEGYFVINSDGQNKQVVLSKRQIKKVTPIFDGYFELRFQSWSPDGKFILFGESSDRNEGKRFLLNLETKELTKI